MSTRSPACQSLIAVTCAVGALLLAGCGKDEKKTPVPATTAGTSAFPSDEQKVSYGLGYNMGKNLASQGGFEVNQDALRAGLTDGLANAKLRVTETELRAAFEAVQTKVQAAQAAEAQKQLAEGNAFLAKNKSKSGVKTTASGLQYEVLKSGGKGPKPKPTDTVVVAYHGTLLDGTVFDSSVERGETATFGLGQVITGWTEGLQLMSVGDKYKFYVPSSLGYGNRANGKIPPNAVLVFEIELKQIK